MAPKVTTSEKTIAAWVKENEAVGIDSEMTRSLVEDDNLPDGIPITSVGGNNQIAVWQNVAWAQRDSGQKPEDLFFVEYKVLKNEWLNLRNLLDDNGVQMFYRKNDLPAGWRPWTTDAFPHQCIEPMCVTRFPNYTRMASHVEHFHPSLYNSMKRVLQAAVEVEAEKNLPEGLKDLVKDKLEEMKNGRV